MNKGETKMKKTAIIKLVTVLFIILPVISVHAESAEDIIEKMDDLQTFRTMKSTGKIISHDRFGTKISEFINISRGKTEFLIEFTSLEERGQKILRTPDELFLFYPDAEEIIRLQGAALRQSMLGSDISYEDMTEGTNTLSRYNVVLTGEESIEGNMCHIIQMDAKKKKTAYPRQIVWVDKVKYVPRKVEYYSRSGKLLKTMELVDFAEEKGKIILTSMIIRDKLKKTSSTELLIETYKLNPPVHPATFTLEELTW